MGVALGPLTMVMPQQGAQGAGRDVSGKGEVLLITWVAGGAERGEVRRVMPGAGAGGQGAVGQASPVFQQQGPQHIGSVLGLDLVRDDHLLHHLVGHSGQGLLVQVQEHGPCKDSIGGSSSPAQRVQGQRESRGQGGSQLSMVQGTITSLTRSFPSPLPTGNAVGLGRGFGAPAVSKATWAGPGPAWPPPPGSTQPPPGAPGWPALCRQKAPLGFTQPYRRDPFRKLPVKSV